MTSLKQPAPIDFKTQYGLPLTEDDDAIVVDLFAGGGGASTGIEQGLGRQVAIAINHNPAAISMHTANHPHAVHHQTDVWEVDPVEDTGGRTVGWLHASPDCRHHSQAAGGQPRKKEIRDLSWVVKKWAGKLRQRRKGPWVISLENVKQILQWGPLIAKRDPATGRVVRLDGTIAEAGERVPRHEQFLVPDPKQKGRTWRRFVRELEGLGYHVEWWVERNCDYGDPTTRQRLYMIATAEGLEPIRPEESHTRKPGKGQKPYRTAADCIDWSNLGNSIRGRKKPLAEATMRRIALGIQKEVLDRPDPFLVPGEAAAAFLAQANGGYNTTHSRPADDPVSTITNRGSQQQLVAANLVQLRGNCDARPADDPLRTLSAGGQHHALSAAHLVTLRKGSIGGPADAPVGTLTGNDHHGLITTDLVRDSLTEEQLEGAVWCAAFLMKYHGTGANIVSLDEPLSTVTTKDRLALVTVWISGDPYVIVDIRLRMLKPRELYRAQGFPDSYIIDRGHDGRRFSQSEQVHMCGNSVSPGTMAAFARANDPWRRRRERGLAA